MSRCLHLRGIAGVKKTQVSDFPSRRVSCILIAPTRWTENVSVQGESVAVPRLGQSNSSNSTNNSESNAVAGLDVLLQLLQNTDASGVTHMSQSADLELSQPHINESAVQVAATALNQLSQKEVPDTPNTTDAPLQPVRLFLRDPLYFPEKCVASNSFADTRRRCYSPSYNSIFLIRRSQLS